MNNIKNYMKSAKILAVAGCLCTVLLLSSCAATRTVLSQDVAASPSSIATDSYVPQKGGELFISVPANIESYDPLLAKDEDLINLLSLIYESPLTVDKEGKIQPNLVESWTVDDTDTLFTFTVRKGVLFHNGNSLTVDDMYDTIMDILALDGTKLETASGDAQATESSAAETSAKPSESQAKPTESAATGEAGSTADEKAIEVNRYTIYNKDIESVTVKDNYTIEIKMKKPGREALYFMTFPVRPKDDASFTQPVGSGPYEVSSMDNNIQLTVNQNWWKVAPFIQSITAKPLDEQSNKLDNYNEGLLDLVTTESIASKKYKAEGKTQAVDYSTNYYDCLIPNLFEDSLKNDDVRKALSYAIDRRTIIATVLLNHAVAAEMPISPDFYAYNSKYSLYEYDPTVAMELLNAAGYKTTTNPQGTTLNLDIIVPRIIGQEYRIEAAREIAAELTKIGVVCNFEELSLNDYTLRLESGDFSLAYCSYYLDQNMDIGFMFDPEGEYNFGHVASPELTGYVDACNAAIDEADVTAAYDTLQQYFMDKVPQIGLYFRMHTIIADASITGITDPVQNHIFDAISTWSMKQSY